MITSAQYSVDGTAVKISATSQTPRHVYIHPSSGTVYVSGTNTVTSSTGLRIDNGTGVTKIEMDSDDELWCIAGTGTHVVTVMERYL